MYKDCFLQTVYLLLRYAGLNIYLGVLSITLTGSFENEVIVTLGVISGGCRGDLCTSCPLVLPSGASGTDVCPSDWTPGLLSAMLTSGMILGTTEETITGRIWEVDAENTQDQHL